MPRHRPNWCNEKTHHVGSRRQRQALGPAPHIPAKATAPELASRRDRFLAAAHLASLHAARRTAPAIAQEGSVTSIRDRHSRRYHPHAVRAGRAAARGRRREKRRASRSRRSAARPVSTGASRIPARTPSTPRAGQGGRSPKRAPGSSDFSAAPAGGNSPVDLGRSGPGMLASNATRSAGPGTPMPSRYGNQTATTRR